MHFVGIRIIRTQHSVDYITVLPHVMQCLFLYFVWLTIKQTQTDTKALTLNWQSSTGSLSHLCPCLAAAVQVTILPAL
jgi:hypothetical protein